MKHLFTFLVPFVVVLSLQAQVPNNTCQSAILLTDLDSWCSDNGAYTTQNATVSGVFVPFCFPLGMSGDVWFRFVANTTDVGISVVGNVPVGPGGTLQNPQFALYEGNCGALNEIQCASDAFGDNVAQTLAGPLNVGETYYIRVDARNGNQGSFQLCVNGFNQIPDPSSDCPTGVVLCDKSPFTVPLLLGAGQQTNEIDPLSCMGQEFSSAWYKWTCDVAGSLTFTLTPTNPTDDLDFMVFELPNGINDCNNKLELRCMASGENIGAPFAQWQPCTGATGLNEQSNDLEEVPGCAPGDDNFLAALQMESGKSYALIVNNFSNTGSGFSVSFGGTGTFLGPKPGIIIDPEVGSQCDLDQIQFSDDSEIPPGFNATYSWTFGGGAQPATATGVGEHDITFNSFGSKSVVLTIETDAGCLVTEVRTIFIEPCCHPDTVLQINLLDVQDPLCFGEASGLIEVAGSGGTGPYLYSLNGNDFQSTGLFQELFSGNYLLYMFDQKGCSDSIPASLFDPPPIQVDAGPDQRLDLGFTTNLVGWVTSPIPEYTNFWTPEEQGRIDCVTCLDSEVAPVTTTTYVLTAIDSLGCRAQDSMQIVIDLLRPIYIPNVFSPNSDGANDFFTAYGGPAATQIRLLRVFDRWGGLMFETRNQLLNDEVQGWNGMYRGKLVNPGVYVYLIEVEFVDGVTGLYKGDVTVLR